MASLSGDDVLNEKIKTDPWLWICYFLLEEDEFSLNDFIKVLDKFENRSKKLLLLKSALECIYKHVSLKIDSSHLDKIAFESLYIEIPPIHENDELLRRVPMRVLFNNIFNNCCASVLFVLITT